MQIHVLQKDNLLPLKLQKKSRSFFQIWISPIEKTTAFGWETSRYWNQTYERYRKSGWHKIRRGVMVAFRLITLVIFIYKVSISMGKVENKSNSFVFCVCVIIKAENQEFSKISAFFLPRDLNRFGAFGRRLLDQWH